MITKNNLTLSKHQGGATLFTSLVFLALMTVVTVSATKVSLLDLLVAGNNQQQVRTFQDTESELKTLTRVTELFIPLVPENPQDEFDATSGIYTLPPRAGNPGLEREIRDTFKRYTCGGFSGQAVSIGPDVSPCDLYDFQVKQNTSNTAVRDRHNRGAGKEKPNANKNSYL